MMASSLLGNLAQVVTLNLAEERHLYLLRIYQYKLQLAGVQLV